MVYFETLHRFNYETYFLGITLTSVHFVKMAGRKIEEVIKTIYRILHEYYFL